MTDNIKNVALVYYKITCTTPYVEETTLVEKYKDLKEALRHYDARKGHCRTCYIINDVVCGTIGTL